MPCKICQNPTLLTEYDAIYDTRFGYPDTFRILRCDRCDFRQTDPTLSDEALSTLYTNFYPRRSMDPAEIQAGCDTRNDLPARWRRWFSGTLYKCFYHVPSGKRVLDIGCGNAHSLLFLTAQGCDAYGIEEDRNVQKLVDTLNVSIEAGNIYTTTYSDHSFDYILASQVLEHIPDPIRFLKAASKMLAPGGKLILSFPNTRGLSRRIFGKRWIHWHIPYHLNHFSPKSLPPLFAAAGLAYTGYKTITPTDWTILQGMDFLKPVPKQGASSPLWSKGTNESDTPTKKNQNAKLRPTKIIKILARRSLNILNRFIDLLKIGDSFLIEVTVAPKSLE